MPSTVEKLSTTRAKLTIEVPFADLKPAIEKAYRELASQISIPGFRKGHVPSAMIDARVGRDTVLGEAINAVIPKVYAEAMEANELMPLGRPEIEITKLVDGEAVECVVEIDIVPEFELPDFSKIAVSVETLADGTNLVDERMEILRERFAQTSAVDRPAQTGDMLIINLAASQDGVALEEAMAEGMTYVIGSGDMIDGLDEAVIGCVAGDERQFETTLVGGGREGEAAEVTVRVVAVSERTLPTLDDEFAQMVSQFDTIEEMKQDLQTGAAREALVGQIRQARDRVLDAVLDLTGFDVPATLVDAEVASRTAQMQEQLQAAGYTMEDYLARMGDPTITTQAELEADTHRLVERGLRTEIILTRVAEVQKIPVDQHDLTAFIYQKAQETGSSPDQVIEHMREHDHLQEWMAQIRQSKALDVMAMTAKVTDESGAKVDIKAILARPIVEED
ncbi:MAG: trigger factor [Propionibacteriaceae bacterium]|nr:trigger factor [Propionibacteriaceae bacterium]